MTRTQFERLVQRIRTTQRYPRLIVRPHPTIENAWQILDGHHRHRALQRLDELTARCDVWSDVDDEQATVLLLTLNRLRGSDDPYRRGELLCTLRELVGEKRLPDLVPETPARLKRLLDVAKPPPVPTRPIQRAKSREAVTFFMTPSQRDQLDQRLPATSSDRAGALLMLLDRAAGEEGHGE